MKDSELAAIADPGQGGARAVAAFSGPGVNVEIARSPRVIEFDPEDRPVERRGPYIPKKYIGRMFDTGTHKTLAQHAEEQGLETFEIVKPENMSETWGVVGLRGEYLKPGDRQQMPVGYGMLLVNSGSAVFVVSSDTAKDEKQIAELEAKGYHFATTTRPAREREEFREVFGRKKSGATKWMAPVLNNPPHPAD